MRPPSDEHARALATLDDMQRRMLRFYRAFLRLLLVVVVAGASWIVLRHARPGTGSQGEWFYFGVFVLLVIGWLSGLLSKASRRARALDRAPQSPPFSFETQEGDGIRKWEFRFGSHPGEEGASERGRGWSFSRSFAGPIRQLPAEAVADDATLDRIEDQLRRGVELDAACSAAQPAYSRWDFLARNAYRSYVKALLDARRDRSR